MTFRVMKVRSLVADEKHHRLQITVLDHFLHFEKFAAPKASEIERQVSTIINGLASVIDAAN